MFPSTQPDSKAKLITKIWAYATGMIALSLLFAGPGRDWKVILLPTSIVSSAALSTIVIWGATRRDRSMPLLTAEQLTELKHRVEDLEAIAVWHEGKSMGVSTGPVLSSREER
jgi:hypothetical protein